MGTTRAFAGDGTRSASNGLTITADGDVSATATTEAFQFGLAGGNGAGSEAVVTSQTEAFIGQRVVRPGEAANPAGTRSVDIRSADGSSRGDVTLNATTKSVATRPEQGVRLGRDQRQHPLPGGEALRATRARTSVRAPRCMRGNLTLNASDPVVTATAQANGVAVGGVTVSALTSEAKISRATEAFVGNGATVDLGGSSLTATATSPANLANAISKGGSGGLIGIGVFDAKAYIGDDTVFLPAEPRRARPTTRPCARP